MANKLCYVVHRYPPYPGGSEYYVQAMAEESKRRGHDVTVFSGEHMGDLNGVKVTSDTNIFNGLNPFDLIIVHGADIPLQNHILVHADKIQAPLLYLIILPSNSEAAQLGMKNAKFLGSSTQDDWNHIRTYKYLDKLVTVRHSLPDKFENVLGTPGLFKREYDIETPYMWLSCGGYWHNKGMHELAETFKSLNRTDVTMVFTGYANVQDAPKESEFVRSFIIEDRKDVLSAMADADLYIMNSTQEGFGLVLLEAMANRTPWAARHIAGAVELQKWGFCYDTQEELKSYLEKYPTFKDVGHIDHILEKGADYIKEFRQISNTVDDIEAVLKKCQQTMKV